VQEWCLRVFGMSATVANMLTHYIRTVVRSQKFGVEAMASRSPLLVPCYRGNLAVALLLTSIGTNELEARCS
ncbi:MAG: hypothetical protein WBZ37_05455, partial [Mycobacterium sp.]